MRPRSPNASWEVGLRRPRLTISSAAVPPRAPGSPPASTSQATSGASTPITLTRGSPGAAVVRSVAPYRFYGAPARAEQQCEGRTTDASHGDGSLLPWPLLGPLDACGGRSQGRSVRVSRRARDSLPGMVGRPGLRLDRPGIRCASSAIRSVAVAGSLSQAARASGRCRASPR